MAFCDFIYASPTVFPFRRDIGIRFDGARNNCATASDKGRDSEATSVMRLYFLAYPIKAIAFFPINEEPNLAPSSQLRI